MEHLRKLNLKEKFDNIRALIFDVDGVLSCSTVGFDDSGELLRKTSVKDGYIIKYALKRGLKVCIITGCSSLAVQNRFGSLGIKDMYFKSKRKISDLEEYMAKEKLDFSEILYVGDDIPDFEVMKKVAVPCCPIDAVDEIKAIALYVSNRKGGEGCVRDIVEQVLRAKNLWLRDNDFET